jgi:poly(beta-D-mannuronate) lyase
MRGFLGVLVWSMLVGQMWAQSAPGAAAGKPRSQALLSPWDMRQVAPTQVAYACPEAKEIAPTISFLNKDYRANPNLSQETLDAAYGESAEAVTQLATQVVRAADAYQQTGSLPAAECAAQFLGLAAFDHAMAGWMPSVDAVYVQTRGLRALAVAYLKIRDSGVIQPEQQELILAWLEDIANKQRNHYDGVVCKSPYQVCGRFNHRGASAGWAVASVGIAANNPAMFRWGLSRYREAVAAVDAEGMVLQCAHGQYLLKFNLELVAALVPLAEYGELNGEPMYGYQHGRVHELIHTVTRGLVDPTQFKDRVHDKQTLPKTFEGWEISWATMYVKRFPDGVIEGLLQQVNDKGLEAWGGEPFGAVPGT